MIFNLEKIKELEVEMSREKGAFDLFALFLREDAPDKWDLVLAADWIERDKEAALKYIAKKAQRSLLKSDLLKLSRIALIDESNPALGAIQSAINVEHGSAEIQNSNFFGLQIDHAYLITSRRRKNTPNNTMEADT